MKRQGKISSSGIIVVTIVVVLAGLIYLARSNRQDQSELTNRELALKCTTDMATQFHIHPNLRIVVKGDEMTVPTNIGVRSTCMNSLHTHEGDGTLHVEAPEKRDFTLGDFFAVWGKPFSSTQLLDQVADDENSVSVSVNGRVVQTYEDTILRDNDRIIITYGPL